MSARGVLPTLGALLLWGRPEAHTAWIAAVAGHVWPVLRRFRGGKGVATAGGGGLVLSLPIGVACAALFVVGARLSKVAALGSLLIAIGYPALVAATGRPGWEIALSSAVGLILVIRHQSNIRRLIRGEERRLKSK